MILYSMKYIAFFSVFFLLLFYSHLDIWYSHNIPFVKSAANYRLLVSPVTLMPDPGVVCGPGPEVWLTVVVDLGGEAKKTAVGAGVRFGSTAGQTFLLQGALQYVHGSVLQVGGLLHSLGIEDQVWGRWEGESNKGHGSRNAMCQQKLTIGQLAL